MFSMEPDLLGLCRSPRTTRFQKILSTGHHCIGHFIVVALVLRKNETKTLQVPNLVGNSSRQKMYLKKNKNK